MTINEAHERAERIWGNERLLSVERAVNSDHWWVNLTPIGPASDTRGITYSAHTLDANGRAACHQECSEREWRL